ncbi:MAG: CPBP family intramembrane glutamic endopeptidase [Bacteroidota bacterium]
MADFPKVGFPYITQAFTDRPKLWRYLLGLLLVIVFFMLGQIASLGLFFAIEGSDAPLINENGAFDLMATKVPPAVSLVIYLILPFAVGIIGLFLAMKYIHKRSFVSLFSPWKNIDWKRYWVSFGLWLALAMIMEVIFYLLNPELYTFSYDPGKFWPLVVVGLIFFPIQTSCEEFIFRGYLLQGFGIASLRGWVSILITAALFGILHGSNPEVLKYGPIILSYYIGVGILLGILTWLDQRIELALGIHAANNFFAAVFLTFSSSAIQTPALFTTEDPNMVTMMVGWLISAAIALAILIPMFGLKKWSSLWESIPIPTSIINHSVESSGEDDVNSIPNV